ncbi:MAG: heparinase II/III-family protein, partial [Magnetospirillum sp.]|nr:heparinase II/III-family protein [Magnetospirillum sp.]
GSFELHWGNVPVVIDPGRSTYEDCAQARHDVSGHSHNALLIDGHDPYPANKPYFAADFRQAICGAAPILNCSESEIKLHHRGFSRLRGVIAVERRCWFEGDQTVIVVDRALGKGRRTMERRLITALPVEEGGRILVGPSVRFRVICDGAIRVEPMTLWSAYGEARPGSCIIISNRNMLPWSGRLRIEALPCVD